MFEEYNTFLKYGKKYLSFYHSMDLRLMLYGMIGYEKKQYHMIAFDLFMRRGGLLRERKIVSGGRKVRIEE